MRGLSCRDRDRHGRSSSRDAVCSAPILLGESSLEDAVSTLDETCRSPPRSPRRPRPIGLSTDPGEKKSQAPMPKGRQLPGGPRNGGRKGPAGGRWCFRHPERLRSGDVADGGGAVEPCSVEVGFDEPGERFSVLMGVSGVRRRARRLHGIFAPWRVRVRPSRRGQAKNHRRGPGGRRPAIRPLTRRSRREARRPSRGGSRRRQELSVAGLRNHQGRIGPGQRTRRGLGRAKALLRRRGFARHYRAIGAERAANSRA